MLHDRFVSRDRLDQGLYTSEKNRGCREASCFLLGMILTVLGTYSAIHNEGNIYFENLEVAEAHGKAVEVDCGGNNFDHTVGRVFHMSGCLVHGAVNWSNVLMSRFGDGTEKKMLGYFKSNFIDEDKDLSGVRLTAHVKMYSRRRAAFWDSIDGANNIPATDMIANGVNIGSWNVSDDILESFPVHRVPLRPSPLYQRPVSSSSWTPPPLPDELNSTNMMVYNDALYSSRDPTNPSSDDVQIFFTVANEKAVSVVATADTNMQLVPWRSSQEKHGATYFRGYKLGLVESGSVSLCTMLDHFIATAHTDAWHGRLRSWILILLGTFSALLSTDAVVVWCHKHGGTTRCEHIMGAFCCSFVVSVLTIVLLCATAAVAFRMNLIHLILLVAAALATIACSACSFRAAGGTLSPPVPPAAAAPVYLTVPAVEAPLIASPSLTSDEGVGSVLEVKKILQVMALGGAVGIFTVGVMVIVATLIDRR